MNQFLKLFRWAWSALVVCALAFAMGGCEGSDGAAGPAGPAGAAGGTGPQGPPGPPGSNAAVTPLESCGVCHSDGSFASAPAAHALAPIEAVSNITFGTANLGADLTVTFDLAADGAAATNYDQVQRAYMTDGATRTDFRATATLTNNGGGNYTVTVPGEGASNNERWLFRVGAGDDRETRVYFWGDTGASPVETLEISAAACNSCHGPEGIDVHGGYFAADDGGEPCLVCHGVGTVPSLAAVAHEYHIGLRDEITFPTYMNNCSVCHSEAPQLAVVNAMPVTGAGCFTCHGSMAGFDFTGLEFHNTIPNPETANCGQCHDGGLAREFVADFHNGSTTGRGGIIWDGVDTSITEGARFNWEVTGVVDDGTNLAISWTASYDGVGVDPCNATVGPGAPVFFVNNRLRVYRNYAQGDDFILGQSTSAPGQALNVDVTDLNTTCAANVATTTIPVDAVVADKGRLALGGRPLVVSVADPADSMAVRVPTPTFDWVIGDGAPAVARRNVVDTAKCLGCHVGSMYQHGGDRVDNVDMCLQCHNAAANEQSVRVGMGVDASEAYDGRVGETFEMKTMLHRIHSAGQDGSPPYLVYRNRGIYAFAPDASAIPNWPGTGQQVVFGSDPPYTTNHNFHAPTYPRSLNECTACHTDDFMVIPDQTQSMATTVEAGSTVWDDQIDDVLQGAATTACVTCHKDGASKGHAYQNSWTPQEFPEGRQTIIDAVN